jgi:hypothetical protein
VRRSVALALARTTSAKSWVVLEVLHLTIFSAALQELRRAQPNISLASIADEMPIMQGSELGHYLDAFRRAGLD